ncbi:MAG: bifunctional phosphoribosylaminoimidazolecarboxamide formyltransferase/IMP cyclohydrolase [Chitinophagales bacterium]|nr:bifunctional phosphoribosylaminoimidazolecarboxamide formyltransferase/IMP cyclohydrolase [Chitinophagales bacterium]
MSHSKKQIQKAILSVYYKDGLDKLVKLLYSQGVELYSTGGTYQFIKDLGLPCVQVESLTGFPEILGGRVKTLHPAIFGGLLARRDLDADVKTMHEHQLPFFDLMICNLYPFEEYLKNNANESELIEKIDIGGVTLIRAAAKNFNDVVCIAQPCDYEKLHQIIEKSNGSTTIEERKFFAANAFDTIAHYDRTIANYFLNIESNPLRYGENPHQQGWFQGDFDDLFEKLNGKEVSYNNILDIDAACRLIQDFSEPTFAIMKHNNSCGLASRKTIQQAYEAAFACDPKSAFGGVLIANRELDEATAESMNSLFFEIIIAPEFSEKALEILKSKKNRIILKQKQNPSYNLKIKSALNGQLVQEDDKSVETRNDWKLVTESAPNEETKLDLEFGIIAVKHLKSNGIALVKNQQLIGMGCGQVSRIDALEHAIKKSIEFGFDLNGAIMASDAFFPFADCVEIAHRAGIIAVAQPGGSMKDQDSIDYCNANKLAMVLTGVRHFNH